MIDPEKPERQAPLYPAAPEERVEFALPAPGTRELPLRLLVLSDVQGAPDPRALSDRVPVEVDAGNFNQVMRSHDLALRFDVPRRLGGGGQLPVSLRVRRLSDLEPEAVAHQVPELRALLELRAGLTTIKGPLGGDKAFRNAIARAVKDPATRARVRREIGLPDEDANDAAVRARIVGAIHEASTTSSEARLAELARDPSKAVRVAVAQSAQTPLHVLLTLVDELPWDVCQSAARRPAEITVAAYERLPSEPRRLRLLPALDEAFHEGAARSTDASVRLEVARVATSPSVLATLAEDPEEEVRWTVGNNRAASRALRLRIHALRPADSGCSYDFARPEQPLETLSFDALIALVRADELRRWSDVEHLAQRALTPAQRGAMTDDASVAVRRALATNAACDDATLRRMVAGADAPLAFDIASSPRASDATRAALAQHPDPLVREAAARAPRRR